MAPRRANVAEGHRQFGGRQLPDDLLAVRGREPPVGVETHHEVAHRVGPHRVESGSCREGIEVVHHPGKIEVAERVNLVRKVSPWCSK